MRSLKPDTILRAIQLFCRRVICRRAWRGGRFLESHERVLTALATIVLASATVALALWTHQDAREQADNSNQQLDIMRRASDQAESRHFASWKLINGLG